jgi:hypothetical protein
MGVRGGASMRMGAAPPSSAPKSLLAVSGESESEVQLPRFDSRALCVAKHWSDTAPNYLLWGPRTVVSRVALILMPQRISRAALRLRSMSATAADPNAVAEPGPQPQPPQQVSHHKPASSLRHLRAMRWHPFKGGRGALGRVGSGIQAAATRCCAVDAALCPQSTTEDVMMAKEAALAPANARAARVQRSKRRVTDWFVVRVLRALTRCVPQPSAISGVSSIAPTNRLGRTASPQLSTCARVAA